MNKRYRIRGGDREARSGEQLGKEAKGKEALSSNGVWPDAFRCASKEVLVVLNLVSVVSDRLAIVFKSFCAVSEGLLKSCSALSIF